MRRIALVMLVIFGWLACGALGSLLGMQILRFERCVTNDDIGGAIACVVLFGPFNLFITPMATTWEVGILRSRTDKKRCVFPRFGGEEK